MRSGSEWGQSLLYIRRSHARLAHALEVSPPLSYVALPDATITGTGKLQRRTL